MGPREPNSSQGPWARNERGQAGFRAVSTASLPPAGRSPPVVRTYRATPVRRKSRQKLPGLEATKHRSHGYSKYHQNLHQFIRIHDKYYLKHILYTLHLGASKPAHQGWVEASCLLTCHNHNHFRLVSIVPAMPCPPLVQIPWALVHSLPCPQ